MAVGINIVSGFDGRGVEKAIKEFGKLETSADRVKFAISKATLPAVGALGALTAAAGLSIKAAIDSQAEQQRLSQILTTTGKATMAQVAALNEQAQALQTVGVVAAGNVTVLQSQLATFDLQADTIERLTPAIVDYVLAEKGAAATADDFKQMTNGLAQALNGQFGALTRVGFVLDDATKAQIENGTEAQRSAALVQVLNSTYGGFNESLRNTTEGSMQAFRNSLSDLRTNIGTALLPAFEKLVGGLNSVAQFGARNTTVVMVLAGAVGVLSAAIVTANAAIKLHTLYTKLMEIEVVKNSRAVGMATTAIKGMGVALVGIAAAEGAVALLNRLTGAAEKQKKVFDQTAASLGEWRDGTGDSTAVVENFFRVVQTESTRTRGIVEQFKDTFTFKDFGREIETGIKLPFGTLQADIEDVDAAFRQFVEASPAAARDLVNAMKAHAVTLDVNSRAYKDLNTIIARYEAQLGLAEAATKGLSGATDDASVKVFRLTGALIAAGSAQRIENYYRMQSTDALKDWNEKAKAAFEATQRAGASTKSLADKLGNYRQALESLTRAQMAVKDATQGVVEAQQKVKDSQQGVQDALRNVAKANDAVTAAVKGVADAERKTADARKSHKNSIKATQTAQEKLAKATQSVAKAQEAFNAAVNGYGAASKQGKKATRELADAQQANERAAYDLEKAQFAIVDAEAELAEIRADAEATPQQIREAEIALAEAKLSLIDSQEAQVDSQDALTQATDNYDQMLNGVYESSDLYKELLAELNQAKDAERQAVDAVTAARENEVKALQAIEDALDGEAEAAKRVEDAKYALAEAERAVEKAKRDEADAIREVAKAQFDEAQSLYEVAKAQREVNDARKAAGGAAAVSKIDAQFDAIRKAIEQVGAETQTAEATTAAAATAAVSGFGLGMAGIGGGLFEAVMLARGGVVTSPTLGIVGEAGPEAVIPLDRAGAMGTTINVTVNAGMGANGADIGKQVVDALRQYERYNGAIPIRVA